MELLSKVAKGLRCIAYTNQCCAECEYRANASAEDCKKDVAKDALEILEYISYWETWDDAKKKVLVKDGSVGPTEHGVACHRCHEYLDASDEYNIAARFCPSCGARMEENQ